MHSVHLNPPLTRAVIAIFLIGILMDCTRITFSALLLLAVARGYLVVNESLGSPKLIAGVLVAATGYWVTILSTSMVHALIENTTYQIADNTMPALDLIILLFAFSYYCFVRPLRARTHTHTQNSPLDSCSTR